jgi:hypothetical protein
MKRLWVATLIRLWLAGEYLAELLKGLFDRPKPSDNMDLFELFRDVSRSL